MKYQLLFSVAATVALGACNNAPPRAGAFDMPPPPPARLVPASEAIDHAYVPTIDPATMNEAEIAQVVPAGPRCSFTYSKDSPPVVVANASRGVTKINGDLVEIAPLNPGTFDRVVAGTLFTADGLQLAVQPLSDTVVEQNGKRRRWEANMRFELAQGLRVDYRGYYSCAT